jgi:nucleotide-binding universal stress UspA family protein
MSTVLSAPTADAGQAELDDERSSPIVAAVDGSAASRAAIGEAVRLSAELRAPIVFVYVRRGPASYLGTPVYQRRLSKELARARHVLDRALGVAREAGVPATAEILEGPPRRRIAELARDRDARLVVVGSRRRRLWPSVTSGVVRAAGRPVVVAAGPRRLAVAR